MKNAITTGNEMVSVAISSLDGRCDDLADKLVCFLSPSFKPRNDATPDWTLDVVHYDSFRCNDSEREAIWFRKSSCPSYNLKGWRANLSSAVVYAADEDSGVGYVVDRATHRVTLFVTPSNPGSWVHLYDFPRYLSMLVAEARGWVTLHASAASLNGRLMLILGDKGAGKTTTMLGLVQAGGAYFSGDKVMAKVVDDELVLHAWPDMPYIGTGSLIGFPDLASRLGVPTKRADGTPEPTSNKHLVDPFRFRDVIAHEPANRMRDAVMLLPAIHARSSAVSLVPKSARRAGDLTNLVEWPHDFLTAQWHGLYLPEAREGVADGGAEVLERLCRLPWMRLEGHDAVSLMDLAA